LIYDEFQMASVTRACRDNTARRRYAEGAVFPTLDFPSDHALISAVFLPGRGPPPPSRVASPRLLSAAPVAAPASLGSGSTVFAGKSAGGADGPVPVSPPGRKARPVALVASEQDESSEEGGSVGASDLGGGGFDGASSSGFSGGGRRRRASMNLYEYWGIADTGAAHTRLARRSDPTATAAAAALAAADWEVEAAGEGEWARTLAPPLRDEVAAAVEGWFVRAAGRPRGAGGGADLDAQRVLLERSEDSLIWIVFRCGPLNSSPNCSIDSQGQALEV
jgi:hypothetical protein